MECKPTFCGWHISYFQLLAANMAQIQMRFHAYLQSDLDALNHILGKYDIGAFLQQNPTPSDIVEVSRVTMT